MARVRRFWMPIGLGAALVIAGLVFAATWAGFQPKHIVVVGNHRVTRHEIVVRAAILRHETIWLQNTGAIAKRIEAIPFVDTASVHRIPPATIEIAIAERTPFAILVSGSESGLADHALRVLDAAPADARLPMLVLEPGLELVPGAFVKTRDAVALRAAYDALNAAQIVPAQIALDRYGGIVVTLSDGLRLLLGTPADLAQKLALVNPILSQVVGRQRRVAALDLRAPATPVIVYR